MKKWLIISVLLVIVGVTIWYFVYAKKDANRLESTERKMKQTSDSPLTVVKSPSQNGVGGKRGGGSENTAVKPGGRAGKN